MARLASSISAEGAPELLAVAEPDSLSRSPSGRGMQRRRSSGGWAAVAAEVGVVEAVRRRSSALAAAATQLGARAGVPSVPDDGALGVMKYSELAALARRCRLPADCLRNDVTAREGLRRYREQCHAGERCDQMYGVFMM